MLHFECFHLCEYVYNVCICVFLHVWLKDHLGCCFSRSTILRQGLLLLDAIYIHQASWSVTSEVLCLPPIPW